MTDIPEDSDHPVTLEEIVFQALGHASMCWNPRPEGLFDSEEASRTGNELLRTLRARGAR
jgi:hypothetical protein